MSAKPDYVVSKLTRPTGGAATGGFVINLTSSTTPMALSQPKDPTLAQFSFFVSRRLEDGRERFRLHMGYFESMQAAEEMLAVVREVYPGAWASEAPGKKLKANNPAPAAAAAPCAVQAGRCRDSARTCAGEACRRSDTGARFRCSAAGPCRRRADTRAAARTASVRRDAAAARTEVRTRTRAVRADATSRNSSR